MLTQWTAIILIVIVGLINFHIPHFLLESKSSVGVAEYLLELVLLGNVIASLFVALGIARSKRWAWVIGIVVCAFSVVLWLVQETVGLPGLPQQWLEPSRIAALLVEGGFILIAWNNVSDACRAESGTRAM